jgi:ADP-ribose pyrophosphatase YjhB (NUDIX family)
MEYKNPTPVAVMIVRLVGQNGEEDVSGILGLTRGIAPFIGEDALPSGFVNEMESIEMAAARELLEETGVETQPEDWQLVSSAITPRNIVLVFAELKHTLDINDVLTGFKVNNEVQKLVVLNPTSQLCFPLHQEALLAAFK